MARDSEAEALRQKAIEAEKTMNGEQLRWASTPKEVPALRRKGVLFSGVLGRRRQYAFATALDQELFVYDRHDTLFTTSLVIRSELGLSPPVFKGTYIAGVSAAPKPEVAQAAPPRRRKAPAAPAEAPPPAPAAPAQKVNKFRKSA